MFGIVVIVVLQFFERMVAIQMDKHKKLAVFIYFILLSFLVIDNNSLEMKIINLGYLIVVLSCSLKFILIVNENKK